MYTVTHMIGMTSTITNPILYAFLNENFTKEFRCVHKAGLGGGSNFESCIYYRERRGALA